MTSPPHPVTAQEVAAAFLDSATRGDIEKARSFYDVEVHHSALTPAFELEQYVELEATGRSTFQPPKPSAEMEQSAVTDISAWLREARCTLVGSSKSIPIARESSLRDPVLSSITSLEFFDLKCEQPMAWVPRTPPSSQQRILALAVVGRRGRGARVSDILFDRSGALYGILAEILIKGQEPEGQ